MGTGDGRLPHAWAREAPERLFVGLDANAAGLREYSVRASRERLGNLAYVRASIEEMPGELRALADRVTVVLPWGSLLAAVGLPSVAALARLRGVCQEAATLTVVLGSDPSRDQAEWRRLGLTALAAEGLAGRVESGYAEAGFEVTRVRAMAAPEIARWPSTWARRLSHGAARSFVRLDAVAV